MIHEKVQVVHPQYRPDHHRGRSPHCRQARRPKLVHHTDNYSFGFGRRGRLGRLVLDDEAVCTKVIDTDNYKLLSDINTKTYVEWEQYTHRSDTRTGCGTDRDSQDSKTGRREHRGAQAAHSLLGQATQAAPPRRRRGGCNCNSNSRCALSTICVVLRVSVSALQRFVAFSPSAVTSFTGAWCCQRKERKELSRTTQEV